VKYGLDLENMLVDSEVLVAVAGAFEVAEVEDDELLEGAEVEEDKMVETRLVVSDVWDEVLVRVLEVATEEVEVETAVLEAADWAGLWDTVVAAWADTPDTVDNLAVVVAVVCWRAIGLLTPIWNGTGPANAVARNKTSITPPRSGWRLDKETIL
jgi:hypothetical protein